VERAERLSRGRGDGLPIFNEAIRPAVGYAAKSEPPLCEEAIRLGGRLLLRMFPSEPEIRTAAVLMLAACARGRAVRR